MKIFRVTATKTFSTEVLVIADDLHDATRKALRASYNGEIEYDYDSEYGVSGICPENITNKTFNEIEKYGIINELGELDYDAELIIERLEKETRRAVIEEYMKKNCMEFEFVKSL